ncbi:hypothetical protein RDV78_01980 [Bacillota bacterium LX-D]|nr:hypothetical protein [Bacillota bacterium LX-D]
MMQKPYFKFFIWILTTGFFFLASSVLISSLGPPASEQQIMQFMSGMMDAMENSLMSLSMSIEHDIVLSQIIFIASSITVPLIILSILAAILVRLRTIK